MSASLPDFFRDERGSVMFWGLLAIGMLLVASTTLVEYTHVSVEGHTDIRQALEAAVKAAAFQVTSQSQANGRPEIGPDAGHTAFREALADNLGLDRATLAPLPGSPLVTVSYQLVVQNRSEFWTYQGGTGVPSGGSGTSGGLPAAFSAGPGAQVTPGNAGPVLVTLDNPGVVAAVSAVPVRLAGHTDKTLFRWAAAKVVKP